MKKVLLTAALTSLALASCSNDEVVTKTTQDPDEIKITTTTSTLSRAYDASTLDAFRLFANQSLEQSTTTKPAVGVELFKNNKMEYEDSKWKFEDKATHYWPSGNFDFFAIADEIQKTTGATAQVNYSDISIDVDKKSGKTAEYYQNYLKTGTVTVSNTINAQGDIVYATATEKNKASNSGTLALNFRHALSQLSFEFQNLTTTLYVEIENIFLLNVYNKGTLKFGFDDTSTNFNGTSSGTTSSIDYNNKEYNDDCTWEIDEVNTTKVNVDYGTATNTAFALAPSFGENGIYTNTTSSPVISYQKVTGETSPIYVMPQKYGYLRAEGYEDYTNNFDINKSSCIVLRCHVYNIPNIDDLKTAITADIATSTSFSEGDGNTELSKALMTAKDESGSKIKEYLGKQVSMYGGSTANDYYQNLYITFPLYFNKGLAAKESDGTSSNAELREEDLQGWQAGKSYKYKIVFGGTNGDNIGGKDPDGNDIFVQLSVSTTVDGQAYNVHNPNDAQDLEDILMGMTNTEKEAAGYSSDNVDTDNDVIENKDGNGREIDI